MSGWFSAIQPRSVGPEPGSKHAEVFALMSRIAAKPGIGLSSRRPLVPLKLI